MKREFHRLSESSFDVLVIGGGIYGAWAAYDAALRGLSVALVEKNDWASATSSCSSKLIHGGLRYLERPDFGLVRKSLAERSLLGRLAPHRVEPLRFVLPLYAGGRVGRWRLKAGLALYDRLAGRRRRVERHRYLSKASMARSYGFLDAHGLRGGFTYGDCVTDDARFTLEIVSGADAAGAVAVNRARVDALLESGGRIHGARVLDEESGESVEVRANVTLNCAGPWASRLVADIRENAVSGVRLTKGVHLVLPALPTDDAFLVLSPLDRRVIFFIPWYGRTLVGTTDTDFSASPDQIRPTPADVTYLLDEAGRVLGDAAWRESDVISGFAGVRTLAGAAGASPSAVSRELRIDEPFERMLMPVGGKFTSARADAASIVDRAVAALGAESPRSVTDTLPFPWLPDEGLRRWEGRQLGRGLGLGLDEPACLACLGRYGRRVEALFDILQQRRELAAPIVQGFPFCLAEVVYAVRHEMARSLEDVLRRRIPVALVCRPEAGDVQRVALLVAAELGWSNERRRAEVASIVAREPREGGVPENA
ncbi:MAG: glycerol-3-phosphate dehydrogenase/oxidase [bacterium]|nr:glycerol-3-phosphate dehydrogenase/oxidase [bacterium]